MTRDTRNILFCLGLFLLAVAATVPFLEMGVTDEWAYAWVARGLAATGHVTYNAWSAVMLLPQLFWAAGFIRLFGFSFLTVRLAALCIAALLVPLVYKLARESGLCPRFATFATLLTALSPVTLAVAPLFLSDIPALFLFTLSLYCGVKAWKAPDSKRFLIQATFMAICGVLSGLDRQIYWLAPVLFVPALGWSRRITGNPKRAETVALGAIWLAAGLAIAAAVLWYQAQPYILVEHTLDQWKNDGFGYLTSHTMVLTTDLAMSAGLLLLPIMLP
ncbi:MAG: glycosyltransferase family 39 protein, partial [Acidobacteriota bacterium]